MPTTAPTRTVPRTDEMAVTTYAAPEHDAARTAPCANCGLLGNGNYCPRCGQETHDLHRSLAGILGEMLDAFAGWDGKIPVTFWMLARRPGKLTTEFFAGRRVRYLRPLRLYLTMSVLFFLSVGLVHNPRARPITFEATATQQQPAVRATGPGGLPLTAAQLERQREEADSAFGAFIARSAGETGPGVVPWIKHRIKEGLRAVKRLPQEQRGPALQAAFFSKVGNTIFLLLPVFAVLMRVFYRRAPIYVAEHFVFALHVHAFAFLAMTFAHLTAAWLPDPWAGVAGLMQLWIPIYLFVALRRVYGGTRWRTALKFVGLTMTYGTILMAATALTALIAIMNLATA